MAVKCGRCHGYHEDSTGVRACYNGEDVATVVVPLPSGARLGDRPKQMKYVNDLRASKRGLPPYSADTVIDQFTISREIDELKPLPKLNTGSKLRQEARVTDDRKGWNIPKGYYATPSVTGNNDLDFWFVQVPTKGRWVGYTFANRVIGGRSSTIKVSHAVGVAALKAIVKMGAEKSGDLYAEKWDHCKYCNLPLSDDASREMRMGETCASNRGFHYQYLAAKRGLKRRDREFAAARAQDEAIAAEKEALDSGMPEWSRN